jgi:hypothetical protein
MPRDDRPAMELVDDDRSSLHVTWSRAGRAILSIGRAQIVLTQAQLEQLVQFFAAGPQGE